MKFRIVSFVMALVLAASLMTVAFANSVEETVSEVEGTVETVTETKVPAVFYLNGNPLTGVVAQCINGTYYVTLSSAMPLLDTTAVVEEENGSASVSAEAVVVTEHVILVEPTEEEIAADRERQAWLETLHRSVVITDQMAADPVTGLPVRQTVSTVTYTDPATGISYTEEELACERLPEAYEEIVAVTDVVDTLVLSAEEGDSYIVANERYLYVPDGVICLEGSVAVPIRVLAEALNLTVAFDKPSGRVDLTSAREVGYLEDGESYYCQDDVYWLSRIIFSESGNQSLAGKIAVANVVLNRVDSASFPNTIYDVIFQKNQFSPAASGSIYREPGVYSVIAAKLALDGAEVLEDVLFFNRTGLKCYASRTRTFVATIGDHTFYA